jgi:REP element-mobilizing transposase RayT
MFTMAGPAIRLPHCRHHTGRMGRSLRLHHPGSAFHIVARTQGHEPWFEDRLKDRIADILLTGMASLDARVVAFIVMDNHLHVVLFQGRSTLGEIMQPSLRRIALLVQKNQSRIGHVFERRFRAKLCNDAEYLPNAILYVHRNPVAAGICTRATDYRWSSANAYEATIPPAFIAVSDGLQAFGNTGSTSLESLRQSYKERLDRQTSDETDAYWAWFCRSVRRRAPSKPYVPFSRHEQRSTLRDLRDVAVHVLRTIDPAADVELVRSRYGSAGVVKARMQLIATLLQRGYPGVDIAGYLRISQATVSRIKSEMRWASLRGMV